jgi:putative alpha-1,2-mannosidase
MCGRTAGYLCWIWGHQVGRPDRTQYWTRFLLDRRYSTEPDGLPGTAILVHVPLS